MRNPLLLLTLAGCTSQGVLIEDPVAPPREPVDEVVFGEPLSMALPQTWSNPKAADIDADGFMDLVATTSDGDVEWLRGDGTGRFDHDVLVSQRTLHDRVLATVFAEPPEPNQTVLLDFDVVDVDADGLADVQLTFRVWDDDGYSEVSGVLLSPTVLVAWQTWTQTASHRVTTVPDLDGDGRVEWVEFSQTPAIHTSSGAVWPLTDAVSWVQYPHVGVIETGDETVFTTLVDGGFGISQIESWTVTADGLIPRPSIQGIYAQDAVFGPRGPGTSTHALLVSHNGIERFDGEAVSSLIRPDEDDAAFFHASIGDFTGDRGLDVLLADGQTAPRLHASADGDALATLPITSPVLPGFGTVVVDLNDDGLDDLVQAAWRDGENNLLVWMNES